MFRAKRLIKTVALTVFCLSLLITDFTAFAMNEDYLDKEKWKSSDNVTIVKIHKTCTTRIGVCELKGNFGYYADNNSMTLYTYFDVDESTVTDDNKEISIEYKFSSASEEYHVAIDKNGMREETPEEERSLFGAESNFYDSLNTFISAAEYYGKDAYLTADVNLWVNGHKYIICEGITLERPTTTKPTTTAKQKKDDKSKKNKNSKKSKKKSKSETTTKFTPHGKYTTSAPSKQGAKNKSSGIGSGSKSKSAPTTVSSKKQKNKSKKKTTGKKNKTGVVINGEDDGQEKAQITRTLPVRITLILAIVLATAGITLLITAAVTKEKKEDKPEEEEKEDNE